MEEQAHILIIDDDDRLRELLRRFLTESGFRVTDAASAAQARHLIESLAFDLLVIDVMMPGEDGVSFLSSLRPENNVPALFLTALAETENRIDGLEAGADDYIGKPFEPRELILRIQRILARQPQKTDDKAIHFGQFSFELETGRLLSEGLPFILQVQSEIFLAHSQKQPIRPYHEMKCKIDLKGEWRAGLLMLPLPDCAAR